MHPIRSVAAQEFLVMLRTRWVGGFGILFLLLVAGFAWFGTADLGIAGIQDFSRTTVTLVNLVCALAPLMALLVGVHGFAFERGSDELLFSQPVSRAAIILGKGLGLLATLAVSTLIGFGFAGALIAWRVGTEGLLSYAAFVALTLLLEVIFLALALLVAAVFRQRLRALGAAVIVWVLFVLLYDLAVIGSTVFLEGPLLQNALFLSVFGNPVDMVRVSQLLVLNGTSFFGPTGAAWVRFLGGEASLAVLLALAVGLWVCVPGALGLRAFQRRDL